MSATLFRGGRLFDGERFLDATDLRTVADGTIAEIGTGLQPKDGEEVVELEGRWLLPGLIDCHVHFREPGLERKEGYLTGSAGALHGGVTTVLEIQNNPPLLTSRKRLDDKLAMLADRSHVDYGCYANLVEESIPELASMRERSPAVKCFLGCSTGAGGVNDEATMRKLFAAAADADFPIVAHCEDNAIMDAAAAAATGADAERHDVMRPLEAEVKSIDDAIRVAHDVGAQLHVFHLSSAPGGDLVKAAQAKGWPVTASTAPHYLLWTAEDAAAAAENRLKVNPSIKAASNKAGLAAQIADATICAVGTDHAPHPLEEKARPYSKAPSGFPSIDLLLPLMCAASDSLGLPIETVLASVTAGPADEFGLSAKGRLRIGGDADLVITNPDELRVADQQRLPSKSKWSPYHGLPFRGWPQVVYLRGRRVFADGAVLGSPTGRSLY